MGEAMKKVTENVADRSRDAIERLARLKVEAELDAGATDANARSVSAAARATSEREAGLLALLKIEQDARAVASVADLELMIANEPRRILRARQIFVIARHGASSRVRAITSLAAVDRTSPLVNLVETAVDRLFASGNGLRTGEFELAAYARAGEDTGTSYPMQNALWVPFADRAGHVFGGMLLAREVPWVDRDQIVAKRLGGAFAHAWAALAVRPTLRKAFGPSRRLNIVLALLALAASVFPVTMTAVAPVEVTARDAFVVAAPLDGVIDSIPVEPNAVVNAGDLIVKFEDTALRNRFELAEREVLVAEARLKTATQLAFDDERGRHDLAVARADLSLKTAQLEFARDLLAKTEIRAPRRGVAAFADRKALIGKPVAVGERLLEIADPGKVEFRIDVPVTDALLIRPDARAKIFLDSDPLAAIEAQVSYSDYQAKPSDANVLSFRTVAHAVDAAHVPRIGTRGTAQLYGEKVALAFYLLRRPLTRLRQWAGL